MSQLSWPQKLLCAATAPVVGALVLLALLSGAAQQWHAPHTE